MSDHDSSKLEAKIDQHIKQMKVFLHQEEECKKHIPQMDDLLLSRDIGYDQRKLRFYREAEKMVDDSLMV